MKVAVYAKIMQRKEGLDFVVDHLNFWIKTFASSGFDFVIYNENVPNLENNYTQQIITKSDLLNDIQVKKLYDQIQLSNIDVKWKPAAFALMSPYFYLKNYNYIIQLDADDIKLKHNAFNYINKALLFMKNANLPILSYDMYNSHHNHWSFGICLSELDLMKEYMLKVLYRNVHRPKWGINIDHMMDMFLKTLPLQYVSFISPTILEHGGPKGYCVSLSSSEEFVNINYYGKKVDIKKIHNKTIIIK